MARTAVCATLRSASTRPRSVQGRPRGVAEEPETLGRGDAVEPVHRPPARIHAGSHHRRSAAVRPCDRRPAPASRSGCRPRAESVRWAPRFAAADSRPACCRRRPSRLRQRTCRGRVPRRSLYQRAHIAVAVRHRRAPCNPDRLIRPRRGQRRDLAIDRRPLADFDFAVLNLDRRPPAPGPQPRRQRREPKRRPEHRIAASLPPP